MKKGEYIEIGPRLEQVLLVIIGNMREDTSPAAGDYVRLAAEIKQLIIGIATVGGSSDEELFGDDLKLDKYFRKRGGGIIDKLFFRG